jgi:hypothetical protein
MTNQARFLVKLTLYVVRIWGFIPPKITSNVCWLKPSLYDETSDFLMVEPLSAAVRPVRSVLAGLRRRKLQSQQKYSPGATWIQINHQAQEALHKW